MKNFFHLFGTQNTKRQFVPAACRVSKKFFTPLTRRISKTFFTPFTRRRKKSRLQLAEYQNRACKPRLHRACGNEHIKKMFTPWARRIKKQKSRLRRADIKNLLYAFGVQYQKKKSRLRRVTHQNCSYARSTQNIKNIGTDWRPLPGGRAEQIQVQVPETGRQPVAGYPASRLAGRLEEFMNTRSFSNFRDCVRMRLMPIDSWQ